MEYCGTISLLAADALAAMFYVYKNTTQNAPWIRRCELCVTVQSRLAETRFAETPILTLTLTLTLKPNPNPKP